MNQGVYTPDAGTVASEKCGVCSDYMRVERDLHAATSWAGAMAGSKRRHDRFECPNLKATWHIQLIKLLEFVEETPSAILSSMVEGEIELIKRTRQHTKEVSDSCFD